MHFTQEILQALPAKDRAELLLWQSLFDDPGYSLQSQLLREQLEAANAVLANATSWDSYQYYRGARDVLSMVLNLQATVEFKVEEKLAELQALADDVPSEEFV